MKLLASGLQLWIRQQCQSVESLDLELQGSAVGLLRGRIDGVQLLARRSVYQHLPIEQVELLSEPISVQVGNLLKGQPLSLDQPFAVGDPASAWLTIRPARFQINKVLNEQQHTNGKIAIKGFTTITSFKPAPPSLKKMPGVYWSEQIPDSSVFRIVADIKTEDINRQLQAGLDGKTFTSGDKSIMLIHTTTACDAASFTVTADITGSAKGTLIILGKPVYDPKSNAFFVDQLDIKFKTKNVIHKAAAWIAEGKIRSELASRLRFSLNDATNEMQATINEKLRELNQKYKMDVKVGLGSTSVENFELLPGQIRTLLRSSLYFEVGIRDFRSFNQF